MCTLQHWQVLTVIKTTLWNKGIITVKLSYNDPLFFHRLPVISLHVGRTSSERTTLVPRDQKNPPKNRPRVHRPWASGWSIIQPHYQTWRQLPQKDKAYQCLISLFIPKSSTTLSNLFVLFCTQTEPVNKGIQKSHLSVHSNTTGRASGQVLHCDLGSIAAPW